MMHSVVGGGVIKGPRVAGPSYLRPHVVHFHTVRVVSPFASFDSPNSPSLVRCRLFDRVREKGGFKVVLEQ